MLRNNKGEKIFIKISLTLFLLVMLLLLFKNLNFYFNTKEKVNLCLTNNNGGKLFGLLTSNVYTVEKKKEILSIIIDDSLRINRGIFTNDQINKIRKLFSNDVPEYAIIMLYKYKVADKINDDIISILIDKTQSFDNKWSAFELLLSNTNNNHDKAELYKIINKSNPKYVIPIFKQMYYNKYKKSKEMSDIERKTSEEIKRLDKIYIPNLKFEMIIYKTMYYLSRESNNKKINSTVDKFRYDYEKEGMDDVEVIQGILHFCISRHYPEYFSENDMYTTLSILIQKIKFSKKNIDIALKPYSQTKNPVLRKLQNILKGGGRLAPP